MKYFSIAELTASQTATRRRIDNTPDEEAIDNLSLLVRHVLDPLRAALGPVFISSGYRSPRLNRAIGGARTSQHVVGQAADLTVSRHDVATVARYIRDNLPYDQLILEFGQWVHVSYNEAGNRTQALTAVKRGRRTVYLAGIVD